ncbi:MAG: transporter substrate-binding domain-containing protein [Calditerrivibrio sp.]|nr:transporter substrate-binding domain-containing protein [Calditerrivibrio sp.]MCA1932407.1 transporter substrate-binding domain-containing protein [Calditerrivibrio sp.]MCA1980490.1 transporter substrate-binding domain-containing protein [Calditerrivibrio sp.]
MKKLFTLFLMIFLLPVFLFASDTKSTLDQVVKSGKLRVGMSTFIPWAMQTKTGEWIGFEIDVAKRLAQDMGVKPEFIPTKWSGIIPALLTGKYDIIIGGMGITPERALKVEFSQPYDYSGMAIVANKNKTNATSLAALNNSDTIITARLGTTAANVAKKFFPNAKIKLFDDEPQAIQELLNGRATAFVSSAPLPAFLAVEHKDKLYLPIKGTFTKEPVGFAVRRGDQAFLNYLNSWITVVSAEGWLEARKSYWFESKDWEKLLN